MPENNLAPLLHASPFALGTPSYTIPLAIAPGSAFDASRGQQYTDLMHWSSQETMRVFGCGGFEAEGRELRVRADARRHVTRINLASAEATPPIGEAPRCLVPELQADESTSTEVCLVVCLFLLRQLIIWRPPPSHIPCHSHHRQHELPSRFRP